MRDSLWLAGCLVLAVLLLGVGSAAERLVLEDGTVVVGELRGLANGVYTVESKGLGVVEIPSAQVTRIERADAPSAPSAPTGAAAAPAASAGDIAGLQQQMLGDGRTVGLLLTLSESPAMQAVLADPEIMALVEAGDLEALARNPKFTALLDDANVAEIQGALGDR